MFLKTVTILTYVSKDDTTYSQALDLIGPGSELRTRMDCGELYGEHSAPRKDPDLVWEDFVE